MRKDKGGGGYVAGGYNDFGLRLLARLVGAGGGENVLVSPVGIALSLAVLLNGAGGETRRAIAESLGAGSEKARSKKAGGEKKARSEKAGGVWGEAFNRENGALRARLERDEAGVQSAVACAVWTGKGVSFDASFVEVAARFYGAEAGSLDFKSEAAVETINGWARERTRGKISALVERGELEGTSCALVNAVYFKGAWASAFERGATREGEFYLEDGRRETVALMSRSGEYLYCEDEAAQCVCLSYAGGETSACFVLPAQGKTLGEFVAGLDAARWHDLVGRLEEKRVELTLPRFEMSFDVDLCAPLDRMGLGIAFKSGADFAPMGMPGDFITSFKHKTLAGVNEEGTEAAATSAVLMGRSLFTPPRMIVNRPFLWAVRDDTSGALLFAGAVFDPS